MSYMQQLLQNPEDISDLTVLMNMALVLMAKAFKLNYTTPTNNNKRISSNPHNRQIAQSGNQIGYNAGHNAGNPNGYNANQVGRNAVQNLLETAQIQLQAEKFNLMVAGAECKEIEEVNANCILMVNLQQASTSGTHDDKALVYDSGGSAEYTELLESNTELQLVQQYDNNIIPVDSSMDPSEGELEQRPATIEETRAFYESLYNNLVIEVEKVNTVNHETKEANVKLTPKLVRYRGREKSFEFNQAI
nr:hypothetical protein [Tanacetum cinerariifolium]